MLLRSTTRRQTRHSEGSWAVSYVDMLTLLLCFFIIFYNANSFNVEKDNNISPLQKVVLDLSKSQIGGMSKKGEIGLGTGLGYGPGVGSGAGTDAESGIKRPTGIAVVPVGNATLTDEEFNLLKLLQSQIQSSKTSSQTRMTEKSLLVEFNGITFFNSGKTEVLPQAKQIIDEVIKVLKPHANYIRIIVQGHTDNRPLSEKTRKQNLSDNWELSVLRATQVLKIFIQEGFPEELLSAEGFSDKKIPKDILEMAENEKEVLALQRRITLRIEPRVNK